MKAKLLLVDVEEESRARMQWALAQDYELLLAVDRPGALKLFKEHQPAVVLLNLGLPPQPGSPEEGLATLDQMLALDCLTKIIVISDERDRANALRAIGSGACDFLQQPIQFDELKVILKRTFHVTELEKDCRELLQPAESDSFEGIIGSSPQMRQVFNVVRKVANSEAPVLVLGESGTGKERVAQAIHARSSRKAGPFVAINCSAIPETLLESELFGHERGAFTGAHVQRRGRIESAAGGTLFLDEIGDLPPYVQVKLLRFLQEQRLERVGGRQEIEVNTRVIAATNVDLNKAIAEGRFREDLYYRLAVVVVGLPPLRERGDDLRMLAQEFLRRCAAEQNTKGLAFSREALRALHEHRWPGNVRELENRVRRAVIMAETKYISAEDLELGVGLATPMILSLREARESVEREMIERALRKHAGKIAPAAAELSVSRPTLYGLMEKLHIHRPEEESKTETEVCAA